MTDRATIEAYLTDEVYALIIEHRTTALVAQDIIATMPSHQTAAQALSEEVEQSAVFHDVVTALLDLVDWRAVVERIDTNR